MFKAMGEVMIDIKGKNWEINKTASINIFINDQLPSFMTFKIKEEYKTINISTIKVEENDEQIVICINKNRSEQLPQN